MRKKSVLALLLIILLVFVGCSSDSNDGVSEYKLKVTVEDNDTESTIDDATVRIDEEKKTGSSTEFELKDGKYEVEVNADGYDEESSEVVIDGENTNKTIKLTENDDGSDDGSVKEITEDTYIYHSEHDSNIEFSNWSDPWDSGTDIETDEDDKVLTLNSGTGWDKEAISVAWGNPEDEGEVIDVSEASYFVFKIKTDDYSKITFQMQSATEEEVEVADYPLDDGEDVGDGWKEIKIPADYFSQITDMTWVALSNDSDTAGTAQIKDIYFSTEEVGTDLSETAPEPTVDEEEVTSIFSDSLSSDGYWIDYMDPWYEPPIYAEEEIDGNKVMKYTITPSGAEGGTVGAQFNESVDALDKTTLHLDMYPTSEVEKVQFQLTSGDDSGVYDVTDFDKNSWNSLDIDFSEFDGNFNASDITHLGIKLSGAAEEKVYFDNIYFQGDAEMNTLDMKVTDDSGNSLDEAEVKIGSKTATTDSNGEVDFELPEGEFTVTTEYDDLAVDQQTITMSGDETLDVELEEKYPEPTTTADKPTISDEDAITLYSDSLEVGPNHISYWEDDWYKAPEFSEKTIDGNDFAKFQIIPGGTEGGATGIQFGVDEQDPLDASETDAIHLDMYVTSGVEKLQFQLVGSDDKKLLKEITSPETGEWVSLEIPYSEMEDIGTETFAPDSLEQLGLTVYGTTKDAVYLDNIYFY
ncbi:MAG: carboxypeptidase-like regulatory domain-containing protein [Bacillota bacterium]